MRILILLIALMLSSCATDETRAYDQARYEANPNYQDDANKSTSSDINGYSPPDRNYGQYFACLLRHSQRFNTKDSRYICDR